MQAASKWQGQWQAQWQGQWAVAGSLMLLATAYSLHLGMDVSWDLLNYHLYAPRLLHGDHLGVDFLGGGPQSYFNPLALWPFYAMVSQQWPPLLIGALLGGLHSLNLVFAYLLCRQVLFRNHAQPQRWSLVAVAMAALSPVYWGAAGSSFIDATVAVPVMAALWCIGRAFHSPVAMRWVLAAGALIGLGVGLKLSVSVFALAAAMALLLAPPAGTDGRKRIFAVAGFSAAAFAGWLLAAGFWSWRLYAEFGNPFFPLFNHLFQSPDYPITPSAHQRFTPQGALDYFTYPFRMALANVWVYIENRAPDIRPAALVISLALVSVMYLRSGRVMRPAATPAALMWIFMLLGYVIWYALSGNGRYALPLFLLVGVGQALLLSALPAKARPMLVALMLMAAQAYVFNASGNPRWGSQGWGDAWVPVTVPERLRSQPHGFLSLQLNSTSFIAPSVHPQSGFVSLQGMLPLYPGEYGDARVRAFMQRYQGRLEALLYLSDSTAGHFKAQQSHPGLAPWGLEVDPPTCHRLALVNSGGGMMGLYSCAVRQATVPDERFTLERKRLTPLFDQVQRACPKLFDPPGWPLTFQGRYWMRRHVTTDIEVFLRNGRFYYSRPDFGPFDVDLGAVSDWEQGRAKPDCTPPRRHYELPQD